MQVITRSSRWPVWVVRLALCVAILGMVPRLSGATAQAPPRAAARPLADLLNPDGTLNLANGFQGSVDARGWRLISGPGEAPRFGPLATAGDENWAGHFGPPGTDQVVYYTLVQSYLWHCWGSPVAETMADRLIRVSGRLTNSRAYPHIQITACDQLTLVEE